MADIRNCIKTHGKTLQDSERATLVADADRFEKDGLDTLKAEEKAVIELANKIQANIVGKKRVMPWEMADATGFITALTDLIVEGKSPKNNNALRKMLTEHDGKEPSQLRMKQAQEDFELAMINAATKYVANATGSQKEIYRHLVKMYQDQPLLNIRTSTSVDNQAYSTPMPLAYAASVLAGIDQTRSIFEPTAGNGALLIDANPNLVKANELDAKRADRLETLGHAVTTEDATTIVENGTIEPLSVDAVITNPPFGGVSRKVKVDGYKISKIDHLIAAEALRAMKDDGSATLIIGANKTEGEHGAADRIFFNWLYSRYNVTSHFEADGKLYARQGAGWPVRIITVAGRKSSDAVSPDPTTINRVKTWDELYEQVENSNTVVDTDWNGTGTDIVISGANLGKGSQPNALTQPVSPEGGVDGGLYTAEGQEAADRADAGLPDAGDRYGVGVGAIEGEGIDEAGRDTGRAPIPAGEDQGLRADQRAERSRPVRVPRGKPERLNETQSVAPTRSTREDGDIRVPTNMEAPLNSALLELEEKVGHVDDFVKERLGYETVEDLHDRLMGLQVDSVAAGIVAIDEGKAIIIADQTGVGKGRQAAALIKHVVDTGRIPVFVTVKDSLFSAMYEDMTDLGNFDYANPFIINQAGFVKVGEGKAAKNIFKNKPAPKHNKSIKDIGATGKLPGKSNVIFATYSQLNKPNIKRDMISSIAANAVFILDESHNAGGQSSTGEYFTELLSTANAAIYLSATYAKRVDNFPVYNKTDLSLAFDGIEQMQEAVEVGGIGMQTLISSALTENGQLIRRERSFDGIKIETIYDTRNKAKHTKMADSVTEGLRAIVTADRMFHTTAVKALQKATKGDGTAVVGSGNKLAAGVSHTNFTSTVHNIVRQTLLAIKADKAAVDAVAALKNGEKPVIALDNTMGSFLDKYTDENGIGFGEDLGAFDFRYVLHRALENSRKVLITGVTGEKESVEIPLSDLPAVVQKAYKSAEAVIDGIKIDAPVSPIDWIRNKVEAAGYSAKEITGRKEKVTYHPDGSKTYERMDRAETTDKVATASQFNSGDVDVLIINRSGSTGISLHSSEKFKNQDPRVMFVVQASLDINDFQQMLGRINRTGQLKTPRFELNTSVLPSEKRIMSVLSRKMRSLNANTSSNTKSATSVEAEDIFNEYGNAIISRYLQDNPEIDNALDVGHDDPDMAEKVTGRISLLPVEVQELFYEEVENNYRELLEYLDKTNQNQLEISVRDLQAEELSKEVLTKGKDPSNVFGRDSFVGHYKVKQEGKPPTSEEVEAEISDSLGNKTPEQYMDALFASKRKGMDAYKAKLNKRLEKAQAMKDKTDKQKEAKESVLKRVNEEISNADWRAQEFEEDIARRFGIGKMSKLQIGEDEYIGAVIGIDDNAKVDGNSPYAKSKTTIHFMLNGAMRQIPVSTSRLTGQDSIFLATMPPTVTKKHAFDDVPREGHEMRYIVTGNLISAFSALHGGTIMSYTDKGGVVHNGVMMPKKFNPSTDVKQSSVIRDPYKVVEFLTDTNYHRDSSRFGVAVSDGSLRIIVEGGGFLIQVKSSKAKGGKWFLDPKLVGITGDFSTMRGSKALMSAEVSKEQLIEALPVIQKRSGLFAPDSMASEAEKYTAQGDVSYSRKRSEDAAPGFYSQLERVIETKLPNKGAPKILAGMIQGMSKKGEIKSEEVEWSGIIDWLNDQTGKVSKQDVIDYLQASNIRVDEITKGDEFTELNAVGNFRAESEEQYGTTQSYEWPIEAQNKLAELQDAAEHPMSVTKFKKYQLPGGKAYKELLLTLPTKASSAAQRINNEIGRLNVEYETASSERQDEITGEIDRLESVETGRGFGDDYISGHYDETNILAHVRFNERTDADGKRVLFVEEVQSDWHQAGRKKGYMTKSVTTSSDVVEAYNKAKAALLEEDLLGFDSIATVVLEIMQNDNYQDLWEFESSKNAEIVEKYRSARIEYEESGRGVPDAPFKTSWPLLAMKRMIRYAAENNFDRIAWTTGAQQAERYDLSKQVDKVSWAKYSDNDLDLFITKLDGSEEKMGRYKLDALPDVIGKELSDKIRKDFDSGEVNGEYSGLDLKVGGEGMKGFYDQILPKTVNKYIKKWGAKVAPGKVGAPVPGFPSFTKDRVIDAHTIDVTPKMKDAAMAGQPLFKQAAPKASGATTADVEKWLGNSVKKLGSWVDVEIVQSVSDMPGRHPADVRGMFYNGKVYLVADNLTKKSARTAFAHEVVGHLGLQGLLGNEGFKALMRQVISMKKSGNKEIKAVLEEIERNYVDSHGRYTLSEAQEAREILAHLAEKNPKFGLVRSVVAKIRMWLAKHGLGNFDNAMIEQLIVRAARQVKESYTGVVSDATAYSRDKTFNDIDSMDYNGIEVKEITDEEQAEFERYFEQVGTGKATDYATYQTIEGKAAKSGWAEATRVVSGGMPAVIYRAGRSKLTPEKFLQLGGRSNLNQAHLGVFLSSGIEGKYGDYIHEVHLDMREPKIYKLSEMEALANSGKFKTVEDVKLLALDLMADGHDGIILEKAGDKGEDHYIVFHPNQVIEIPSVEPAYSRAGDSVSSVMEDIYLKEREPSGQSLGMPEEVFFGRWQRRLQDSFNRVKTLQETIINQGGIVDVDSDVYLAEERSSGMITARLTDLDRNHMRPLIKAMADKDITLTELDEYMIARHAAERNEYIASINPDMQDGGSGLTTAEARGILGSFSASKLASLEALSDMVYAVNNKALAELVEGGHLTQETVDEWQDRYNYYVPLKGKEGEESRMGSGKGFSVSGSGIRRALGRGAGNIAESPTAHTFAQAENTIVRTEKTKIGQALVNLIRENPDPAFWSISQRTFRKFVDLYGEPFEGYETAPEGMVDGLDYHRVKTITNEERLTAQEEGRPPVPQVVFKIDPQYKHRDDVFSVMVEGQELLINIKDEIVSEQLKKMNSTQLNAVVRGAGQVNRYLAMINTALNPEFVITNLERDFQTAMINLSGEQSGKMAYEVMKAMPMATRGIWQSVFDKGESEWRTEFEEMQAEGGTIGFFGLEDIDTKVAKIQSKLEPKDTILGKTGRGLSKVRDIVLDANLSVENAARLAAYKIAKEKWIADGMPEAEAKARAASLAKNLTVNFNRKGEWSPALNSAYLFYNASIQGSARVITALGNRRVQKIVGGVAMTAFALAMYNAAAGGDDDDGIPYWDKISDFTKQTNLIIMSPMGDHKAGTGDGGRYFKIKLPYGYNVFFYAGTAMRDMMFNPRKTVPQTAMSMVSAVMNAFNPIQGADLMDTITPTVLKPFVQDERNKNFMDAQIKPESPFDKTRPESEKAWKGTSPELKEMMRAINEATGGDQTHAGLIDISPESVKHYVGWLTGGAGKTAVRTYETASGLLRGEDVEQKQIPFIRTLGGKPSAYFDTERFYAASEEVAAAKKQIELTKGTSDIFEARAKYDHIAKLDNRLKQSKKRIKKYRIQRDRAYNKDDIEGANDLKERIRQEMMMFSVAYDDAVAE